MNFGLAAQLIAFMMNWCRTPWYVAACFLPCANGGGHGKRAADKNTVSLSQRIDRCQKPLQELSMAEKGMTFLACWFWGTVCWSLWDGLGIMNSFQSLPNPRTRHWLLLHQVCRSFICNCVGLAAAILAVVAITVSPVRSKTRLTSGTFSGSFLQFYANSRKVSQWVLSLIIWAASRSP